MKSIIRKKNRMCLAIPMRITELFSPDSALAESGGVSMEVSLKLVENVDVGDYILVHTGFALEVLDQEEVKKTLDLFHEIIKAVEP